MSNILPQTTAKKTRDSDNHPTKNCSDHFK